MVTKAERLFKSAERESKKMSVWSATHRLSCAILEYFLTHDKESAAFDFWKRKVQSEKVMSRDQACRNLITDFVRREEEDLWPPYRKVLKLGKEGEVENRGALAEQSVELEEEIVRYVEYAQMCACLVAILRMMLNDRRIIQLA